MSSVYDNTAQSDAIDLRVYLRPVWRWKWVIVLIVIVATGGTYFLVSRQPKKYVTSATLMISDPDPAATVESGQPSVGADSEDLANLATLFTDQAITATVYKQLGRPVGSGGSVSVEPLVGSNAVPTSDLVITATSSSPTLAAQLANTYVSVFAASQRNADAEQATVDLIDTEKALDQLADTPSNAVERETLLTEEAQLRTLVLNPQSGATPIDVALVPTAPYSPTPRRDAILGAIVGLLLGIGAAFGLEMLDRRLIRVSTVESMYGVPVLAVLPHVRDPAPSPNGQAAIPLAFLEAVRSLRINISMASAQGSARALLVTSAVPGEGKSTVVRDLALVCAESGESVLVIDADLRRPSIAKLFGVDPELGLVQVLRGEVANGQATVHVHRASLNNASANGKIEAGPAGDSRLRGSIDLLSYGERVANPVPLLSSAEMTALLSAAKRRYNTVIVDSAPLLAVADTVPLLEMADAVLLVARLGLTTRDSASRLTSLIGRVARVNIVGVVTNDIRGRLLDERYGGYSGYRPHGQDTRGRTATSRSG